MWPLEEAICWHELNQDTLDANPFFGATLPVQLFHRVSQASPGLFPTETSVSPTSCTPNNARAREHNASIGLYIITHNAAGCPPPPSTESKTQVTQACISFFLAICVKVKCSSKCSHPDIYDACFWLQKIQFPPGPLVPLTPPAFSSGYMTSQLDMLPLHTHTPPPPISSSL